MTEAITMYHSTNMQTDLDDATEAVQIRVLLLPGLSVCILCFKTSLSFPAAT